MTQEKISCPLNPHKFEDFQVSLKILHKNKCMAGTILEFLKIVSYQN